MCYLFSAPDDLGSVPEQLRAIHQQVGQEIEQLRAINQQYVCVCAYIYIYIYTHIHTHTHIILRSTKNK